MKKGILVISILLFLIISTALIIKINTKPKTITGEATNQNVAINITLSGPPELSIISPKNQTYLTWQDLKFNFTAQNADYIWYKLDSSSNQSLNSPTNINLTQGSHTLHLYTNNSHGETGKNVTFNINSSFFIIKDDHYEENDDINESLGHMSRNEKKGESTDFLDYSYEELQNLSDLIIHDSNRGKIKFNEAINITKDSNPSDNVLDLNSYTNISYNKIEINTTALPNFNKPATLYLYNLTFTNPKIARDGIVCPETICKIVSYSNGVLVFNVTGFSAYSAEESHSSSATGAATTDEAGGLKPEDFFSTDKEEISVKLKQGEIKQEQLIIKNTRTAKLSFTVSGINLQEIIKIEGQTFELEAGEEKIIAINFATKEDAMPDLYAGKLMIAGGLVKKEIPIFVEVETQKALLDVSLKINQKQIIPGEMLSFNIELQNLEEAALEALINYIIKNKDGKTIILEKEMIELDREKTITKSIKTPENFNLGEYILYVKVEYNGQTASASQGFFVVKEKRLALKESLVLYLIFLIVITVLIVIIYKLKALKKRRKQTNKPGKINTHIIL